MNSEDAAELGRKVGRALLGTCDYPEAYIEREELDPGLTDNAAFCYALDATAMCCEGCGWYCEPCDLDDDQRCDECGGGKDA